MSVRAGAEANDAWAQLLIGRKATSDKEGQELRVAAAERLAKAAQFVLNADEFGFIWVDLEARWEKYARIGIQQSLLLGQAGNFTAADKKMVEIGTMLASNLDSADPDEEGSVKSWKMKHILARQNLCLLSTSSSQDVEGMLSCR